MRSQDEEVEDKEVEDEDIKDEVEDKDIEFPYADVSFGVRSVPSTISIVSDAHNY